MTYAKKPNPPRKHRSRVNEILRALKVSTPCTDCGLQFHFSAMQFDHLAPKAFNLSQAHCKNMQAVVEEINKCEIVCANCHAIRTFKRQKQARILNGGKRLQSGDFTGDLQSVGAN